MELSKVQELREGESIVLRSGDDRISVSECVAEEISDFNKDCDNSVSKKMLDTHIKFKANGLDTYEIVALEQLREMLKTADFKVPFTTAEFLLPYLRAKSYDIDRSFNLLRRCHNLARMDTTMFPKFVPTRFEKLYSEYGITAGVKRDGKGRGVVAIHIEKWKIEEFCLDDVIAAGVIFMDSLNQSYPEIQFNGTIIVVDLKGLSLQHARQFRPLRLQQLAYLIQDSFPVKFKEIHLLNQPYVFNMLFAIIKTFLKQKIKDRIFLHSSDLKSLHKSVCPTILPSTFGGHIAINSFADMNLIQSICDKDDYYKEWCNFGHE